MVTRLFKLQQTELKEKMCECGLRAKTLGINTLRDYMREMGVSFTIAPKMTSNMVNGKKKNTRYWEVVSTDTITNENT